VLSAAFSPDGHQVVTVSWDHTAGIWDARTGTEIALLKGTDQLESARSARTAPGS
jgi:WD40 repeat protein